jgi:hypothetical protein
MALVLGLIVFWYVLSYHTWEFRGPGTIRDNGVFTYPRFRVLLDKVPLSEAGQHRFTFKGVPSEEMSLQFDVVGKTDRDAAELDNLTSEIELLLSDDHGNILCSTSGSPKAKAWILLHSTDYAGFYTPTCQNRRMDRWRSYTLQLHLKDVDARSPKAFLRPSLAGGGIELP